MLYLSRSPARLRKPPPSCIRPQYNRQPRLGAGLAPASFCSRGREWGRGAGARIPPSHGQLLPPPTHTLLSVCRNHRPSCGLPMCVDRLATDVGGGGTSNLPLIFPCFATYYYYYLLLLLLFILAITSTWAAPATLPLRLRNETHFLETETPRDHHGHGHVSFTSVTTAAGSDFSETETHSVAPPHRAVSRSPSDTHSRGDPHGSGSEHSDVGHHSETASQGLTPKQTPPPRQVHGVPRSPPRCGGRRCSPTHFPHPLPQPLLAAPVSAPFACNPWLALDSNVACRRVEEEELFYCQIAMSVWPTPCATC